MYDSTAVNEDSGASPLKRPGTLRLVLRWPLDGALVSDEEVVLRLAQLLQAACCEDCSQFRICAAASVNGQIISPFKLFHDNVGIVLSACIPEGANRKQCHLINPEL